MTKMITTSVSDEYYNLAKHHEIKWSAALARGIRALVDGENHTKQIYQLGEANKKLHNKLTELSMRLESEIQKTNKV